ncbi:MULTISPECIES: hypothetical protein [unclassified Corynebacterium]|uniref:hypothetical protein n=1 Tax=unclassified Corynebacterium TaxID=2624378 RepID=UPI001EF750C6|nr:MULTISPECIES: hypothetical protein [unclassified Corynebacterium]MCG7289150.1 hypothetical protein [Corynebacterium sp. ACRPZ]MCG7293236.1 hypothetical protein [Corynebacterium sp. ACRPY]
MRPASSKTHSTRRAALLAVPAALLLAAPLAPVANAQLPGGMSPEEIQSMIPGEISVPAGESTTVDVGVPVDVNYSSGGWTVTSSGTSVTVSAPNQPGATAAVPASAGGYSATVNLVAVGDGSADVGGNAGESGQPGGAEGGAGGAAAGGGTADSETDGGSEASGSGSGSKDSHDAPASKAGSAGGADSAGNAGGSAPAAAHPSRSKAEPADDVAATKLYFDGEIQDNKIVVKVPLSRVKDLMKYASYDTEGATLRYLDVNGQVIEGVERKVDKTSRTITLTYPEGETPDNPFIMEVVRDGKADFVAVITSTNVPVEKAGDSNEDNQYGNYANQDGQGRGVDEGSSISDVVPLAIAGAALLAAIALLIVFLRRRRGRA